MINGLQRTHANAVVLICDNNYLPPALFVAHQLLDQPHINFDILILTMGPCAAVPSLDPRIQILPCTLDPRLVEKSSHAFRSSVTYARLSLGELLFPAYQRVLYLDCDVWIGARALSSLFTTDMGGRVLAAVRDAAEIVRLDSLGWQNYKARVGLPVNAPYFNAGMLLIDLNAFVTQRIGERAIEYIAQGHDLGGLDDQTALNIITQGQWVELSPVWNWMFAPRRRLTRQVNPGIIHFIGRNKPWADRKGKHDPVYAAKMRAALSTLGLGDFVAPATSKRLASLKSLLSWLPHPRDRRILNYMKNKAFL